MLRAAEGYARQLDRQRVPWASAHALSTRAGASMVRGDTVNARRQLIAAVDAFDTISMGVYAAAARRHLGNLVGGDEGRDLDRLCRRLDDRAGDQQPSADGRGYHTWLRGAITRLLLHGNLGLGRLFLSRSSSAWRNLELAG